MGCRWGGSDPRPYTLLECIDALEAAAEREFRLRDFAQNADGSWPSLTQGPTIPWSARVKPCQVAILALDYMSGYTNPLA
jgi:hypothetical protein